MISSKARSSPKRDLELLHGTTLRRAEQIVSDQGFRAGGELYLVPRSHVDLAEWFARRRAQNEGGAAVVVTVVIDDLLFQSLRKEGHAVYEPFDAADNAALLGRHQWRVSHVGLAKLNPRWLDISYRLVQDQV